MAELCEDTRLPLPCPLHPGVDRYHVAVLTDAGGGFGPLVDRVTATLTHHGVTVYPWPPSAPLPGSPSPGDTPRRGSLGRGSPTRGESRESPLGESYRETRRRGSHPRDVGIQNNHHRVSPTRELQLAGGSPGGSPTRVSSGRDGRPREGSIPADPLREALLTARKVVVAVAPCYYGPMTGQSAVAGRLLAGLREKAAVRGAGAVVVVRGPGAADRRLPWLGELGAIGVDASSDGWEEALLAALSRPGEADLPHLYRHGAAAPLAYNFVFGQLTETVREMAVGDRSGLTPPHICVLVPASCSTPDTTSLTAIPNGVHIVVPQELTTLCHLANVADNICSMAQSDLPLEGQLFYFTLQALLQRHKFSGVTVEPLYYWDDDITVTEVLKNLRM